MKKRLLALGMVMGMTATMLAGCGGKEASVVGEWSITKVKAGDMEEVKTVEEVMKDMAEESGADVSDEELQQAISMITSLTMELKEDGTAVMSDEYLGGDTVEGSWEETGDNTYSVEFEGDSLEMTLDGDELTGESGGTVLVFGR